MLISGRIARRLKRFFALSGRNAGHTCCQGDHQGCVGCGESHAVGVECMHKSKAQTLLREYDVMEFGDGETVE